MSSPRAVTLDRGVERAHKRVEGWPKWMREMSGFEPRNKRECEDCGEPITLQQLLVDGKCWNCRRPPRLNVDYSMRRGPHEAPWWCRDE